MVEKHTEESVIQNESGYGVSPEIASGLSDALADGDSKAASDYLEELHASDIAQFINQSEADSRERVLSLLSGTSFEPETLTYIDEAFRDEVIAHLGAKDCAEALHQLEIDDALEIIEDMEQEGQEQLLKQMSKRRRAEIEQNLAFPENIAGRIMDTHIVTIPEDWTVGDAIDYLRSKRNLPDSFYSIYVTNKDGQPSGAVQASRILMNKRHKPIAELMEEDIKKVSAETDQEDVAHLFHRYGFVTLPVVDDEGKMIGIITVDDIVDVIDEEAEEDILRLAGVGQESDIFATITDTAKKRFPWLFVNLLTAIAASAVIALFTNSIESIVALAVMMPIVASMGGNAGTQTLTVAVRALATKELTSNNAKRIVNKEMLVGLLNGLGLATICGVTAGLIYENMTLAITFAVSVLLTLIVAGLAGALIPLALEKLKLDPAIASGVFLTTVTDMVGFFVFLGIATLLLL